MRLTYFPFEGSDADYEARVQIANAESAGDESHVPRTVEDMRWEDSHRRTEAFCERVFVYAHGKRIGTASCIEDLDDGTAGNHAVSLTLRPEFAGAGLEAPILRHLLEVSKAGGGRVATAYVRNHRKGHIDALEEIGFQCVDRDPRIRLDLQRFDASCFASAVREVERQGIALRSIPELQSDGVDWVPKAYELCRELVLDVPALGHMRTWGIDEFRERTHSPEGFPEAFVVAIDGERWVGQTDMIRFEGNRGVAMTVLSGVVRTHRRRGIATAVKVRSLELAKRAGVRFVDTDNQGNAPCARSTSGWVSKRST